MIVAGSLGVGGPNPTRSGRVSFVNVRRKRRAMECCAYFCAVVAELSFLLAGRLPRPLCIHKLTYIQARGYI